MRLGTLLLRDAVIGLNQLEEALRAQVLYGGRLGTNLLELELIDLDTLGVYLSKVHAVPLATAARFEAADPGVVARFGREVAERHTAFAIGPEPLRPETIAVAMADPHAVGRIDDIQRSLGAPVAPYVAAELRILYYLEKHYGIQRRPRVLRPGDAAGAEPPVAGSRRERRRTQPSPVAAPPLVRFEPRTRAPRDTVPRIQAVAPLVTLEVAAREVENATHRDQIADAVIDLAGGRLGAAGLFIVRAQAAIGWRGLSAEGKRLSGGAFEQLALPLGGSSVLQACFDTGKVHHGVSPSAGKPIERQIWAALGVKPADEPEEMLVVPVLLKKRVINLIYGHGPGRGITATHVIELTDLAELISEGYERLIRAARADK